MLACCCELLYICFRGCCSGLATNATVENWLQIVRRLFWRGHFIRITEEKPVSALAFLYQEDG